MLISFGIINESNRFVSTIMTFLFKLVEPVLNFIRRFIPNFGAVDISPIILIIIIVAIQEVMGRYGF
jgi:YggT family protein